jgi:integrase
MSSREHGSTYRVRELGSVAPWGELALESFRQDRTGRKPWVARVRRVGGQGGEVLRRERGTRSAAVEAAALALEERRRLHAADRAAAEAAAAPTVGMLLDRLVEHRATGADGIARTPGAVRSLRADASWVPAEIRLWRADTVTVAMAGDVARQLASTTTHRGRPLSARSRARTWGLLRAAWDLAGLASSPWRAVTIHGGSPRKVAAPLRPGEQVAFRQAVLRAADGESTGWAPSGGHGATVDTAFEQLRAAALWWLIGRTGLRHAEALGLQEDELADDLAAVRVTHQVVPLRAGETDADVVVARGGYALVARTKTRESEAVVPIPTDARELLRAYMAAKRRARLAATLWRPDRTVFTTGVGGFLSPRNSRRDLDRLAKDAGIAGLTPHRLRDTHLSSLHAAGADLRTIQAAARHASPRMTAAYVRAAEELTAEAAERAAASWGGPATETG